MMKFEVSPDGRFLAFIGSYGYIYLLSAKVSSPGHLRVACHCLTTASRGEFDGAGTAVKCYCKYT